MNSLYKDEIIMIAKRLPFKDLLSLMTSCRKFFTLKDEQFWKNARFPNAEIISHLSYEFGKCHIIKKISYHINREIWNFQDCIDQVLLYNKLNQLIDEIIREELISTGRLSNSIERKFGCSFYSAQNSYFSRLIKNLIEKTIIIKK